MPFGLALRAIKSRHRRDRRKPGQKVITPALMNAEDSECWMANAICGFRPLIAYLVHLCLPRFFGVVNPV